MFTNPCVLRLGAIASSNASSRLLQATAVRGDRARCGALAPRALLAAISLLGAVPAHAVEGEKPGPPPERGSKARAPVDPARTPRMQLKLDAEDRAALDQGISYSLPEPPAGLEWIGSPALGVDAMRGRVLVVQSVSTRAANWRNTVEALRRQLGSFDHDPPVVILVHTPEGADRARSLLEPLLDGWIGIVDGEGAWCDELGFWKRPVNLVVDRNGIVRYAGLTPEGVKAAVELLREEETDPGAPSKPRPPAPAAGSVSFPVFANPVAFAIDRRGTKMPAFEVESWLNGQPAPGDRLIVIDFWATWCKPCRDAIPHMNELASRFESDACFVGLSNETKSAFEEGAAKHKLKERDFKYALALDPKGRLMSYFGVKGLPHCVVASADGVVRWQGSPRELTPDVMRKLIEANRGLSQSAKGPRSSAPRGWKSAGDGAHGGGPGGGSGGSSSGRGGRRY